MRTTIKQYIEDKVPRLKDRVFPVITEDVSDVSCVYQITPQSGGHMKESQMELKIISEDYDECIELGEQLNAIFDMENDQQYIKYKGLMFHSELSGGGMLWNGPYCENTIYYILNWRKTNG